MANLLRLLMQLNCRITFAAATLEAQDTYTDRLQDMGIELLGRPAHCSIEEHLRKRGKEYDVVLLSRVAIAAAYFASVRQYAPRAFTIFDTVDLHYLREYRGARLTGNLKLLKRALQTKHQELALARASDCTLVVSAAEKTLLEKECPTANVRILSNIHEVYEPVAPFATRSDILFIGSFMHHPNIDAVIYFYEEIFPLLKEKIPEIKVYIIGAAPPEPILELNAQDFIVTDHISDIAPYFNRCKLSVAPLRYGAGVKGKVHLSMSYGLPVVASSVAIEGIPVRQGHDVVIADEPADFCQGICDVYHDEALWKRLSANGCKLIDEHYSFEAARSGLVELLTQVHAATA